MNQQLHRNQQKEVFSSLNYQFLASLEGEEAINNQSQSQPNQENVVQQEPYSRQYLEQRFRIFFLYHIVGVGFAVLYAANNLEIILSYIHLISYCVIIAAKAREKESMMQFCTFLCYFIDIMLMISGTAGMNVK